MVGVVGERVEGGDGGRLVGAAQDVLAGRLTRGLHVLQRRGAQQVRDQVQLQGEDSAVNPLSARAIFEILPYLPFFMHRVCALCQADLRILAIFTPVY